MNLKPCIVTLFFWLYVAISVKAQGEKEYCIASLYAVSVVEHEIQKENRSFFFFLNDTVYVLTDIMPRLDCGWSLDSVDFSSLNQFESKFQKKWESSLDLTNIVKLDESRTAFIQHYKLSIRYDIRNCTHTKSPQLLLQEVNYSYFNSAMVESNALIFILNTLIG